MANQNEYIYIADGNEEIFRKLMEDRETGCEIVSDEMLFGKEAVKLLFEKEAVIEVLKLQFNPLLDKQNILILDDNYNVIETIPYMSIEKEAHIKILQKLSTDETIFWFILDYIERKDIQILKRIYQECEKQNRKLNTLVLKKTAEYFASEIPNQVRATELIALLQENLFINEEQDTGHQTDKKYDINYVLKQHEQKLIDYKKQVVEQVERDETKKNLIVFHMESISNEIFGNHRYEFRSIEKLMNQSLNFGKFYSSATSSAMSISDFIHGNDFEMDRFTNFHAMKVDGRYGKGLYKILEEQGYITLGIGYNYFPKTEEVNSHGIWDSKCGPYRWIDDFETFMEQLIEFIGEYREKPFAIHVWNLMPHVGQKCQDTEEAMNFYDRINMAYESLNMTIETIYDILKQYDLVEKTVIAGYGDHGDDKWTRSMNAGFTHTIEPYHNIINTPAFIYDSRLEPLYSDEPVSLVDMKRTLLYLTGNEIAQEFAASGINIFKENHDYVFSKRLFANQQYYEGIQAYSMMKLHDFCNQEYRNPAYAIIGRKYTLLVSNNGCEMFMNQLDSLSYNNILNFYQMDEDGNLVDFDNQGAWRGHFRTIMMRDEQVYDVVSAFYEMSEQLRKRIRYHETMAGEELQYTFDEQNFKKIRSRGFLEE